MTVPACHPVWRKRIICRRGWDNSFSATEPSPQGCRSGCSPCLTPAPLACRDCRMTGRSWCSAAESLCSMLDRELWTCSGWKEISCKTFVRPPCWAAAVTMLESGHAGLSPLFWKDADPTSHPETSGGIREAAVAAWATPH
jgi:hypothetical protein